MFVLLLKLILTPLLIGGATLVGRKWGPAVSGWLVGLPLTSGPISLFLAFEQGKVFAAHAAQGTLTGLISVAFFCVAYAWLSLWANWPLCWLGSWSVFFLATLLFEHLAIVLPVVALCVPVALMIAFLLLPTGDEVAHSVKAPVWDVPLRILIATAFVVLLTGAATLLGSRLSGLLSPLPIFSTIIAVFTQRLYGASSARHVLRGVMIGSFAFAIFFLIVAVLLPRLSIALTFLCALFGALCMQSISLWLLQRRIINA